MNPVYSTFSSNKSQRSEIALSRPQRKPYLKHKYTEFTILMFKHMHYFSMFISVVDLITAHILQSFC